MQRRGEIALRGDSVLRSGELLPGKPGLELRPRFPCALAVVGAAFGQSRSEVGRDARRWADHGAQSAGADGIDSGRYKSTARSLDTSEVVIVPLTSLARLVYECPSLEALLYRVLSRELVRVQNMAWTLGTLGAEGRVAAFLLALSARLGALGYSRCSFNLRMTRQEIGSYLGLKLETVSRALSALNASGIVQVHQRSIDIVDADALRGVLDPAAYVPAGIAPHLGSTPARSGVNNDRRARKPRAQFPAGLAGRQLAAA